MDCRWRFFLSYSDLHTGVCTLNNTKMILKKKRKKVQRQDPPSPLHTRRLKSQHQEIITTFLFSTSHYELALEGGVRPPLHSPSLRFIPLGLVYSGLMDFVFF